MARVRRMQPARERDETMERAIGKRVIVRET
jgi:hypothetical protein